jgi:hypothetical protein
MGGSVSASWKDPLTSTILLEMKATVTITKAIIDVACESNLGGTEEYDSQVLSRAFNLAATTVNIFAFSKGMGLSIVLETAVTPDGITRPIRANLPHLEPLATALKPNEHGGIDINTFLPIIISDPAVFIALHDLVGCIVRVQDAPLRCGRAVEAIRYAMFPADNRRANWPSMQENLNLTQNFLEFITEHSKGPRHGDLRGSTLVTAREMIRRSWIVMNRFLEFRKRGGKPLPVSEFVLLNE